MPLFKKNQRYKVSRKSDFIQVVTLLDGSQMECNLSADSLPSDCLENVLQRLEVREVALFGLKYLTTSGELRWADFDTPLKKQLEKYASSHMVYIGLFYYIDRAYALQDDATRYQYYLQLKSDVLDSKLYCTLEQAILLAGYALQAEYQNYDDARRSEEYIKEIERLDNTLLPRNLVAEYDGPSALADIAQHIVSSHMTLSGLTSTQSEIAYIHLAQQMDGCGVEYVKAMSTETVFLGSSSTGVSVRRPDGHIKQQFNWSQISDIICNKKSLQINITNKKLSTKYTLDDIDSCKYVHKVLQLQQEFFHDDHSHLLYSDDELAAQQENSEPLLSPARHAKQLSNLSNSVIYDTSRPSRENAVDVIEEEPATSNSSSRDIPDMVSTTEGGSRGATPDLIDTQYESDYATMKFKVPISERPRALTASMYAGSKETPMLDQLHKNDLLHRSMTALQEYRDSFEQQNPPPSTAEGFLAASQPRTAIYAQYAGSADHLNTHSPQNITSVLSRSMHGLELSSHHQSSLPSYRPSPDYDMVMKERSMYGRAYMPEAYNQQQTVRELQNGTVQPDPRSIYPHYTVQSSSQSDLTPTNAVDSKEPLYANLEFSPHQGQQTEFAAAIDRNQQPTPYQNHQNHETQPVYYQREPHSTIEHVYTQPSIPLDSQFYPRFRAEHSPDILNQYHSAVQQAPDITNPGEVLAYMSSGSPDVISKRYLAEAPHTPPSANGARLQSSLREDRLSVRSQGNSSRSSSGRGQSSAHGSRGGSSVSGNELTVQQNVYPKSPIDERVQGLEEKLKTDTIAAEYESLLKKRQPADCRVALRPENDARNRFPNVLPYEDTRVRLIATSTNPHGYINASHVEMTVANEKLTYIATQNPFENTLQDFWQMIWAYNVSIIAMVTEVEERGAQKCPKYWPSVPGLQNAVSVNDLKIVLKHTASASNFTTSCLRVVKTSTKEQRTIWHIQYTDWHLLNGCPRDVRGFLALLDELNSVRLHIQTSKQISPRMLVHCSTGVGRSGVVILSDVMRKCLENNEKISVASTLKELRQQRMYMVQTLAQYKFVHEVLVHYLKGVRLI